MKVYNCINCGKEAEWGRSKVNKYCGNSCQGQYQSRMRVQKWLDGDIDIPPRHGVKNYLLEQQDSCCAICNMKNVWNGKELVFVLDHINGNSYDNSRENLRLICHNCDSQTEFYKNRNKGNGRHYRRQRYAEGKSF